MEENKFSRRNFIKRSALGTTALSLGGILPGFSAESYNRIIGANEKIRSCIMGVYSRGLAHVNNFCDLNDSEIVHICDVDKRAIDKAIARVVEKGKKKPKAYTDLRKSLESKDVDALVIATPDHWHAPAALMAMKAGKHVYLEKPCSHSPREGEILIEAAKKYNKVVQMGNQRRSWPNIVQGIQELKDGAIGKFSYGKSWYSNTRGSIGIGKQVDVPEWLDWELWQGPAPRRPYKDNYVHYNWHWFWHWGTGEALNNGTHVVDLLRWGFGVDYPVRVSSFGGRYHFQDDWETPDTQVISFEFDNGVTFTWEGRSCNGAPVEGTVVGAMFYGDKGSLLLTGGNEYKIFDLKGKLVKEVKASQAINVRDTSNPSQNLDAAHIQNFFDAIRKGAVLASDIDGGHKSTLLVQLGNIAQRVGHDLKINPQNGRIVDDMKAMEFWSREYEKGWDMVV